MMKSFHNFALIKFGLSFSTCLISQTAAYATDGQYIQQSIGKTTVFVIKEGQRPLILTMESAEPLDSDALYQILSTGTQGRNPVKITPYTAEDYQAYLQQGNNIASVETIYVVVPNSWLGKAGNDNQLDKEGIIRVNDNTLLNVPSDELPQVIKQRYVPLKSSPSSSSSLFGGGAKTQTLSSTTYEQKTQPKRFNAYDEEEYAEEDSNDINLTVKAVGKKSEEVKTQEEYYQDEAPLANLDGVHVSTNVIYLEKEEVSHSIGSDEHTPQTAKTKAFAGLNEKSLGIRSSIYKVKGTSDEEGAKLMPRDLKEVIATADVISTTQPEPIEPEVSDLGAREHTPANIKTNYPGYHDRGLQHPTPILQSSGTTDDREPLVVYNALKDVETTTNVMEVEQPAPPPRSLGGDQHYSTQNSPAPKNNPGYNDKYNDNSKGPAVGNNTPPPPSVNEQNIEQLSEADREPEEVVKEEPTTPPEPVNPFEGITTGSRVITVNDTDRITPKSHVDSNGARGYSINLNDKNATLKVSGGLEQKDAIKQVEKQRLANQSIKDASLKAASVTTTNEVASTVGSKESARPKQAPGTVEHTFLAQNEPAASGTKNTVNTTTTLAANTDTTPTSLPTPRPSSQNLNNNLPTDAALPSQNLNNITPTPTPTTTTTTPTPTTSPTTSTTTTTTTTTTPLLSPTTTPSTTVTEPVITPLSPANDTTPATTNTTTTPTPTTATPTPPTPTTNTTNVNTPTTNTNSPSTATPKTPNGSGNAVEPNSATAQGNGKTSAGANQDVLINFNNVSVIEYISFISKLTGKNFVFDQADLNFNVTIVSNEPTTLNNVMQALLQALRVQGLSLMEVGNNIIIHRNKKVNAPTEIVTGDQKSNAELVTRVFHLSNTDPEKMAEIVRPMLSDLAVIAPITSSGTLIVTDLTANVNKIADLIDSLDASKSGFQIGRYVVVNTSLETAITLTQKIMEPIAQGKTLTFNPDPSTNSIFIVSTPYLLQRSIAVLQQVDVQAGSSQILSDKAPEGIRGSGEGLTGSQIFPTQGAEIPETTVRLSNGQTQTLKGGIRLGDGSIQFSDKSTLKPDGTFTANSVNGGNETNKVVEVLGSRGSNNTNAPPRVGRTEPIVFKIFKLRHRKGDQLADAFKKIGQSLISTGQQNTNLQYANLLSALNSVQWVEATNSLVFSGTPRVLEDIAELIDKLDVQVRQVLIEMLILDTTIADSLTFGVEWDSNFSTFNAAGATSFLSSSSSPLNLVFSQPNNINPLPGMNTSIIDVMNLDAVGLSGQTGFSLGVIGRNLIRGNYVFPTIGALVTALHNDTSTNIVMNPKIVVEENNAAEIFVGENIQYRTQAITNDQGTIVTQNYEYRDIGSKLKVTPFISNDDIITLEIEQELSEPEVLTLQPGLAGAGLGSQSQITTAVTGVLASPGPNTRKSTTTTKVHLPDRYFLIISGMISDTPTVSRAQVPCLGGVPVLGAAFSQSQYDDVKRNVMIFIRPQIVENDEIHRATKRQQDLFIEKTRVLDREDFEVDQALEFFNLKHICDPNRWSDYNWSP